MKQNHFRILTLCFGLTMLSSCTNTRVLTFVPVIQDGKTILKIVTENEPQTSQEQGLVRMPDEVKTDTEKQYWRDSLAKSKSLGLMPYVEGSKPKDDINSPDLFKVSHIQGYNVGKWKQATASDFGFNPNSSKNLMQVSEGGKTAWLVKPKSLSLSYKSQKSDKVSYIIPSQLLTDEYLKNPFNVLALIGSLCEGHGSWNGKVFIFNPNVSKHSDPGSNKGEFQFNSGLFSGQHTPITGAHAAIFALNQNNSDLSSQVDIFKKGYYIDATREYIPQMIEGLKRHGIYDKKLSIPAFANIIDTFVQNGTGRNDGHKTNLFLLSYMQIKNYSRAQVIAYLKSKRVDSSDLDGGFDQMDTESLKIFAARMNVFVDSAVTRDEFCFNQPTCGMGRVHAGQKAYNPGITWTGTVANDQFRRQQAVINLVTFKDMQNLANAKISAIPDGK
jgi:hypothetical protein